MRSSVLLADSARVELGGALLHQLLAGWLEIHSFLTLYLLLVALGLLACQRAEKFLTCPKLGTCKGPQNFGMSIPWPDKLCAKIIGALVLKLAQVPWLFLEPQDSEIFSTSSAWTDEKTLSFALGVRGGARGLLARGRCRDTGFRRPGRHWS